MSELYSRQETKKNAAPTGGDLIVYTDPEDKKVISEFKQREDFESKRISRLIDLSDLSRKPNSPVKFIIDAVLGIPQLKGFDVLEIPQTATSDISFDLFNVPADHPSRKKTDTYYVASQRLLRTHTTIMWYYYLNDPEIRKKLEEEGCVKTLAFGKVYRKDEIDHTHFPVFHQVDALYLVRKTDEEITIETLQKVWADLIKAVFGPAIEYQFLDDTFPFTDPSSQVEIKNGDKWLEVVGGGLVHKKVLEHMNIDPEKYHGWAFGFGLERLAMIKNKIPDIRILWSDDERITSQFTDLNSEFKDISKYPAITRDISFIVDKTMSLNSFYEIVRDFGGELVEEVSMMDQYENDAKLGADKKSYTFHIVFRSYERTLLNSEINDMFKQIEESVRKELNAVIR